MAVSKTELEKLARLARLRFSDEEMEKFSREFEEIIAFADTINQSVEGGTDMIRSVGSHSVGIEELREDSVIPSATYERIFSNVEAENGFFRVKRVKK
ncbi:MAG: Asp-tRNA(Asn)/Glu-tRNA(Gln) amidotransferase subunit GatC [Oscillospiraceae bacterium]|jgi:aspartyl-tRNA(Asn)/glutamyl-tRNA(Gln) amidotransferase subunit C